ncbi:MAG: hypothetical protein KDD89_02800 [Anaerolineales bacterium]|nr:hypothetical protein [Anaerolineales bacterium]
MTTTNASPFQVLAMPLNRPDVVDLLHQQLSQPTAGTSLNILAQRPTAAARRHWLADMHHTPTLSQFLTIHDPHHHLVPTTTTQLVPAQFLREAGFLTRNMGGWSPLYFGVGQWLASPEADVLGRHTAVLKTYGPRIHYFGSHEPLVAARLHQETGLEWPALLRAVRHLADQRTNALLRPEDPAPRWPTWTRYAEQVYRWLETETIGRWNEPLVTVAGVAVPRLLLLDELLHFLVRIEAERRTAVLQQNPAIADALGAWQEQFTAVTNLFFILKGEYIMGRHRRSTIMLLPELGVVVKQPGLEPFHEVQLNARTSPSGQPENWPHLLADGALVTAAGRIRLILEDGLIPRLNNVFGLNVLFSSLLGLSIEPHITGPTFQEYIWANPSQLTLDFYQQIVMHQQVCEQLQVENGDWHAANFMVDEQTQKLTHIDWGAARPLLPHEKNETEALARLKQVKNIAYSFNDEALAARTEALHEQLVQDDALLADVRRRARIVVASAE